MAITVHKSQGMTLDGIKIGPEGRRLLKGYVVPSRVRDLDNMYFMASTASMLAVSPGCTGD